MKDEIEFWVADEWTMVYLNGELQRAGDHYLADEWLQNHVGVKVVQDEDGVCIPDGHNAIKSLDEARAAMEAKKAVNREAQRLRDQAADLLAKADELEFE